MTDEGPPPARERYGFTRTACGCALCAAPCRHIPGSLDVADLERLCPPGRDLFAWAEEHLRAVTDKPYPTLVPARGGGGACHWFFDGKCAVHEASPYGCAFFDAHMGEDEVRKRSEATVQARRADAAAGGLYYRVWQHLDRKGLIAPSGNRQALADEVRRIRRGAERRLRRSRPS
jgi:hypothetical protein